MKPQQIKGCGIYRGMPIWSSLSCVINPGVQLPQFDGPTIGKVSPQGSAGRRIAGTLVKSNCPAVLGPRTYEVSSVLLVVVATAPPNSMIVIIWAWMEPAA